MKNLRNGLPLSRALLDLGVFSAAINCLLLVLPIYMLQIYDRIVPSSSMDTLLYISIMAAAAVLTLGLLEIVRALYANRVASRVDAVCGDHLFAAAIDGPRAGLGDVLPLRDLATIRGFIGSRAVFSVFDLPFGPFFIALLYFIHPVLFLVTLAGSTVVLALAVANHRATRGIGRQASESLTSAMTTAQFFVRNAETVRTLGMLKGTKAFWGAQFAQSIRSADQVVAINATYGSLSRGIRILIQIAMYGIGGYLTLKGEMTAGMIFAASLVSARALQPLDQIIGSWKQIADASAAWRRIRACLEAPAAATAAATIELPMPQGGVRAEDLVYFLPDSREGMPPLIKRVSFAAAAGEALAVIGPSRAGKSTLARLLVRAIEPRSGLIRLDGADMRSWDREKLGAHIGYLPQDIELLPGTIGQNIARFDPDATSEKVLAAAAFAQAHGMILSQRGGYDTLVGPAGVRLSGGEKQRIGLARAFYGDPKLLVLDEPNSNLDTEGEAALERAVLDARARGATVILITHKPRIAAKCDRVLVLRDGQVEMIGPAGDVLRRLSGIQQAGKQPKAEILRMPGADRMAPTDTAQFNPG
ncbi:MAG: type I secretion system permease/ATPase [Xanthobacteraceae bacterium]|nr:type I secretion system permease/ATPase [Xanthobacteraceae bacterium]